MAYNELSRIPNERWLPIAGGGLALASLLFSYMEIPILGGVMPSDLGTEYVVLALACAGVALYVGLGSNKGQRLRGDETVALGISAASGAAALVLLYSDMKNINDDLSPIPGFDEVKDVLGKQLGIDLRPGFGAWMLAGAVVLIAVAAIRSRARTRVHPTPATPRPVRSNSGPGPRQPTPHDDWI